MILTDSFTGATSVAVTVPYQHIGFLGVIIVAGQGDLSISDPGWGLILSGGGIPAKALYIRQFADPVSPSDAHLTVNIASTGAGGIGTDIIVIAASVSYRAGWNVTTTFTGTTAGYSGTTPPSSVDWPGIAPSDIPTFAVLPFGWIDIEGVTGIGLTPVSPLADLEHLTRTITESFGGSGEMGLLLASDPTGPPFDGHGTGIPGWDPAYSAAVSYSGTPVTFDIDLYFLRFDAVVNTQGGFRVGGVGVGRSGF